VLNCFTVWFVFQYKSAIKISISVRIKEQKGSFVYLSII